MRASHGRRPETMKKGWNRLKSVPHLPRRNTMSSEEREDRKIYKVVINHEEQYSIWPVDRENAPGWQDAGRSGTKEECLSYIKEVWTDMRPLSLRKQMEQATTQM